MKKITAGYIHSSAAYVAKKAKQYQLLDKKPEVGDLMYGKVVRIGQHSDIENKSGRIHSVNVGSKSLFVYGNRYAPDYYEGVIPTECETEVDMLARSGLIGTMKCKAGKVQEPTRIRILGNVIGDDGHPINTVNMSLIDAKVKTKKADRAKLILVVGTSMNSGKSATAAACCWALSSMGHEVRASKVTGTASLKDILKMQDSGASIVSDFTHFGYPSTYMLEQDDLLKIFNETDLKYANNARNFWVVEIADGIIQRETAMLLRSPDVRSRIHRLMFAAADAFSAIGGVRVLKEEFALEPDAISGIVSSSPLGIREMSNYTTIPVLDNQSQDLKSFSNILL